MHAFQKKSLQAVLLLSLGGLGCEWLPGHEDEKDNTAPKNITVTATAGSGSQWELTATAEDDGKLAKAVFSVDGSSACTAEGVRNSGQSYSCLWDSASTTPGTHQVTATVHDAAGNSATSAPISITVSDPSNHAPTITRVLATPASFDEGSATSLSVTASDMDGDELTYTWTQVPAAPAGTFGGGTGATRTWTAPFLSSNTSFTLQVTVSDGWGGSAQATVDVAVANVPSLNHPPTVDAAITAAAPVVAGDVNLSIGATDPDGDPLTYAWSTSVAGQGTFVTPAASATQWRSPDLAAATFYTFQVTVSDGTASVTRTLEVQVGVPEYARDIQPIWDAQCTGCHSSAGRGGLNLLAGSSYSSLVNTSAAGAPCGGAGRTRVVPSNLDASLLVNKLGPTPVCGDRMPQFNPAYFDNNPGQLTRIRSWILAGAPNN
ncbi:Ig-like domain-containing protein [Archangium gephyra]|uniref:Ig-like domain-containing protein n=1 Tax=Archangium gephyra TaxID=48 RepID=UPI0035D4A1D9